MTSNSKTEDIFKSRKRDAILHDCLSVIVAALLDGRSEAMHSQTKIQHHSILEKGPRVSVALIYLISVKRVGTLLLIVVTGVLLKING